MIIDGKKIATEIIQELKKRPKPRKSLVAIFVGESAESESFIKQKDKAAKEIGVDFDIRRFPADVKEEFLREEFARLTNDKNCGGIILQLPLPDHINRDEIIEIIPPEKDVDNLTVRAPVLAPAVGVVETIIENCKLKIENLRVTVVGLGFLIGRPVAAWLKGKCAELYLLDSGDDLGILKQADLVVVGVGKAGFIKPDMLKESALVIDFGYDLKNGKLSGDFDDSKIRNSKLEIRNLRYTPTPGGTGPILVAKLFVNFYILTKNK